MQAWRFILGDNYIVPIRMLCSGVMIIFCGLGLKLGDVTLPTSLSIFSPKVTVIKNLEWLSQILIVYQLERERFWLWERWVVLHLVRLCWLWLGRMIGFLWFLQLVWPQNPSAQLWREKLRGCKPHRGPESDTMSTNYLHMCYILI